MPKKDKPENKSESPKIITLPSNQDPPSPPPEEQQPRKFNESVLWKFLQANEYGDAQLFIHLQKDKFIYDHAARQWYYWNDHYWRQDILNQVITAVDSVIEVYGEEMMRQDWAAAKARKEKNDNAAESAEKKAKAYRKRIEQLQTLKRRETIVKMSSMSTTGLGTSGEDWDLYPWLLCCKNGVIDLKTGTFNQGQPGLKIKTATSIPWEGMDAPCPTWELFIQSIFNNDNDLVEYIQKLLGFFITGDTNNHILPIFWGIGRNGKGTLLETIGAVLGPYSGPIEAETLLQQKFHKTSGSATSDIMALRGKRLVWTSETDEGRSVSASKIKWLSGGDCLTGREVYGRHNVSFQATHHAILMTNNKPHAQAGDYALWERFRLIPFELSFVDEPRKPFERKADRGLLEKLKKEYPGILAWLVRGCLEFQKGIQTPPSVLAATDAYQKEEDILREFIEDCVVDQSGEKVQAQILYNEYTAWSSSVGLRPMSGKKFGKEMRNRFEHEKYGCIYYKNIAVISSFEKSKEGWEGYR